MFEFMISWVFQYQEVFVWIGLLSFLTFLLGLLLVPFVIMRLPEDYFLFHKINGQASIGFGGASILFLVLKNFIGGVLLCLGFLMLFLPGPGLMVVVIGLALLDIPGKRRMLGCVLRIAGIRTVINGLRVRRGRPALKFED